MSISTNYGQTSGGYYSLTQSGSAAGAASSSANAKKEAAAAAVAESLSAYMLDLSPTAQKFLNATTSTSSAPDSFVLSKEQQARLEDIMEKYKDAPYTQETFNQIQADLQKAGMSPDQLAGQEQAKAFNTTLALLDALSGRTSNMNENAPQNDSEKYDTKKKNFIQQIISKFQEIAATSSSS